MGLIICKKKALKPYRIKEVDINVWTIEELCFYIYYFTILISSDFICPNLLYFIYTDLELPKLSNILNSMLLKKESMSNMLYTILDYSFLYSKEELQKFKQEIIKLTSMTRNEQIELAGDLLFNLGKYEKAIKLYEQLSDQSLNKYKKMAFSYSKMQNYDNAISVYSKGIEVLDNMKGLEEDIATNNVKMTLLKNLYYVCRLNNTREVFNQYIHRVDDSTITDWDIEYIQTSIKVKDEYNLKSFDEMFLMDENYLRTNISSMINIWKEQYRGLV